MSTKKITINASELVGTDVNFVSLVAKGANRIPFRVTKSEGSDMLDFSAIGKKLFKSAPVVPVVIAAVVAKSADLDVVKDVLTKSGLSVEAMSEEGEVIVFKQGDIKADAGDVTIFKMDENVALMVTGLQKMFSGYEFEAMDFNAVLATEGFYPSLHMAKEMLSNTISNIMYEAESAAVAKEAIDKATRDFSSYVAGIASMLPEKAFKADNAIAKSAGTAMDGGKGWKDKKKGKGAGKDMEDDMSKSKSKKEEISQSPAHGNDTDTSKPGGPNNPNIEGSPAHGNDTDTSKPGGANNPNIEGSPAAKSETEEQKDPMAAVLAAIETIKSDLSTKIDGVSKNVEGLTGKLTEVEDRVGKAEEAVTGTVHNSTVADPAKTMKSEKPDLGLIDTALSRIA